MSESSSGDQVRAREEFDSTPRHFYADGVAMMKGEALLFDGGRFPGVVKDLTAANGADGKLFPAGVLIGDGTAGEISDGRVKCDDGRAVCRARVGRAEHRMIRLLRNGGARRLPWAMKVPRRV